MKIKQNTTRKKIRSNHERYRLNQKGFKKPPHKIHPPHIPQKNVTCQGWKHNVCLTTGHTFGNSCHPTKDGHGGTNSIVDGVQYYQCEQSIQKNPIAMIYGKDYSCLYGGDAVWDASLGLDYYTGRPGCDYLGMHEDYCYSMYDTPEILETGYDYDFSASTTYCGEGFWNYSGTAASGCQPSAVPNGTEVCGTGCCSCGMRTCSDQLVEWDCQNCGDDNNLDCQPVNNATGTSGPDGGEYHPENYNGSWDHFANGSVLAGRSFNRTNCTWVYDNFCSANPEWTTVACDAPACQSATMGILYPDSFGFNMKECCMNGPCEHSVDCYSDIGDVNGDGNWSVLDIVLLANCVLTDSCDQLDQPCAGDFTGDGFHNVLDIVQLANCILAQNCG